jgi:hypothetical protein
MPKIQTTAKPRRLSRSCSAKEALANEDAHADEEEEEVEAERADNAYQTFNQHQPLQVPEEAHPQHNPFKTTLLLIIQIHTLRSIINNKC